MLQALLYVHAVTPALETLLIHSAAARKLLGNRDFIIRITIQGTTSTTLHFKQQKLQVLAKPANADIHLTFENPFQIIALLQDKRPSFPHLDFPQKPCPQHLHILPALLHILDSCLTPPKDKPSLLLHLRLLLDIAYRALPYFAEHDTATKCILHNTPRGILQVHVSGTDIAGWIHWDGTSVETSTQSPPPQYPDTLITFNNPLTAYQAFHEKLDTHAAIGLHQMCIEGNLPFADKISALLEKLTLVLPR